jgi:hypothetical protein
MPYSAPKSLHPWRRVRASERAVRRAKKARKWKEGRKKREKKEKKRKAMEGQKNVLDNKLIP